MNADPEEPVAFQSQVKAVCDLYQAASSLHEQGIHLVSTDEMTAIQALERSHPTLPMRPGDVERQEFEYIRHGTQSLIASNCSQQQNRSIENETGARYWQRDRTTRDCQDTRNLTPTLACALAHARLTECTKKAPKLACTITWGVCLDNLFFGSL